MSKVMDANKKIEDAVVGGYKKIEDAVVGGYQKIEDKFVDTFLKKDGETTKEVKERLQREVVEREKEKFEHLDNLEDVHSDINED